MIGKAYKSILPYYDKISKTQKFKSRPCLVIGQADEGDYVILPISKITDKGKVDTNYDMPLYKSVVTFLDNDSYLRTHKQTVVNIASLKDQLCDFKLSYNEIYTEALLKVEEFQGKMISEALR